MNLFFAEHLWGFWNFLQNYKTVRPQNSYLYKDNDAWFTPPVVCLLNMTCQLEAYMFQNLHTNVAERLHVRMQQNDVKFRRVCRHQSARILFSVWAWNLKLRHCPNREWFLSTFVIKKAWTNMYLIFTVRLHVMQRTVLLSEFCPSVCPSDACIVTKLNNALRIFWYHMKRQSL